MENTVPDAPKDPAEIQEFMRRAEQGDKDALGHLLAHYQQRLRRMVDLRMDPRLRDRLDASDVVQEACLEAARRFEEYRRNPTLPFHLWIRFITRQKLEGLWRHHLGAKARDARREVKGGGGGGSDSSVHQAAELICSETSPTGLVKRNEERARVQVALEALEPLDREVLILRHVEHLSNQETATELGLQPAAASKRYVRALTRLKKHLTDPAGDGMP